MARFFIDRPVFAWVVAILIMMMGVLAIHELPVAQYPSIAPPSISVTATYSGASAETLQDSVTAVIEQQLSGIDNLLYMSSTSDATGRSVITLYFLPGTDPDVAQVQVQNKVQLAMPSLPLTVQQQGVVVAKATRNFMMFATLYSEDGSMDEIALGNYIASNVLEPIRRLNGVGEANMFGTEYAMRIWIDPVKLASYELTPADVSDAIRAQNTQVPVGQIGATPAVPGQQLNVILQGRTTLKDVKEFENILLRVNPDGSRVYLRDVARVELGGQDYSTKARVNGMPSAAVAIKLSPTGNAMQTAELVRQKMEELSRFFPPGVKIKYPLDTSTFVKISIHEVIKTLFEAVVLVFLVMYLFLQNFRTTLIPTLVVPVALMGTFAGMLALGFSINVLTMFGMVLAIGILVDDAIVVVENVERIMSDEGLPPREATRKAMDQITGALVGITTVLTAVFIPMAFFSGSVGAIYRQFSITLVLSMAFSFFLAMSLTPALCASLLKPVEKGHGAHGVGGPFGWFFNGFNRLFSWFTRKYKHSVTVAIRRGLASMAAFAVLCYGAVYLFGKIPTSFLPEEDQGYFITIIQLPEGATMERTLEVVKQVEQFYLAQPEIDSFITVSGFSHNGRGQNSALAFVRLKPWEERVGKAHSVQAVIGRAFGAFKSIKDAMVVPVNPPAISELGNGAGFELMLQDVGGLGHQALVDARNQLMALAARSKNVVGLRTQGLEDTAQVKIEIDHVKAQSLGVEPKDLNSVLQASFGSDYVNNFVNGNRVQRVIVQLDAPFRMKLEDIGKVHVRNNRGEMVPVSAFTRLTWTYGSPQLQRYNGFPAINLVGQAAPGKSTGDAMADIEEMIKQLPNGIGYEWTGQSYQEKLSGSQAPMLYAISIAVVFLCLAALYESWSIPTAVMLVVPLGLFGALLAAWMRGLPNDVYFKVGLLVTIGLSVKNAILIIEFAKDLYEQGKGLVEAAIEAAGLRLRPILMTSFAFILGVLPLATSTGAGSASQNAIGTGVIGGMITGTVFAIILVPVFYVVVMRLTGKRDKAAKVKKEADTAEAVAS